MPAGSFGMRVCAFLRERCGFREFWIETRINFGKRMNDRLCPVTMNDLHRGNPARRILVNELLGRLLQTFSANRRDNEGEAGRKCVARRVSIAGNVPLRKGKLATTLLAAESAERISDNATRRPSCLRIARNCHRSDRHAAGGFSCSSRSQSDRLRICNVRIRNS